MGVCPIVVALGLATVAPAAGPSDAKPKVVPALKLIKKGEVVARAKLEMRPDVLTNEMHRKSMLMSYPQMLKLSSEKPEKVKKEPAYAGSPHYGVLTVGSGPNREFLLVFDEPDSGAGAKLYLDANHNGDLTDDPPVKWDSVKTEKDKTFLETLLRVPASWSDSQGETTSGTYGVSLRKTQGANRAFLTRAGARTGTLTLGGKTYPVALADNTADAVFDNAHAKKAKKLGVWLMVDLNGDKDYHPTESGREVLETSAPFELAGAWYTAEFPEDGSEVILKTSAAPPTLPQKPRIPLVKVGQTLPDFEMLAANGARSKLSDSHGKVRVLDLWATWCGPCVAAMPRVEALYQKVKDQGVEVIGVNVMDEEAKFKDWVKEKSDTFHYTFARDAGGKNHEASGLAERLGVYAIPTVFLVDKQDKVVLVLQGFGDAGEAKLKAALKDLGVNAE
jgi:thiol-disulfide isomerase/thioredoxin